MNLYNYRRRKSEEVKIGNILMGAGHRIVVQSMANTNTNDIEESVAQCLRIVQAGGELVRFTTQGIKEAESLHLIHQKIREQGCNVPLIADVHFNANVADVDARYVEKVRVNPGNYIADTKIAGDNFTDEEYLAEAERLKERFLSFLDICKENGTAIRIGVNHGSLSERMLNRWGNSTEGMVESSMELQRVCKEQHFKDVVLSMKASNTVVMVQSVRELVEKMDKEGLNFPFHLGVTEAGDGEDGRIKSAAGIGALLADGIGDTIRVSLSEEPEVEIPVAKLLRDYIAQREGHAKIELKSDKPLNINFSKRKTLQINNIIGGENQPIVVVKENTHPLLKADFIYSDDKITDVNGVEYPVLSADKFLYETSNDKLIFVKLNYAELNLSLIEQLKENSNAVILMYSTHINPVGEMRAFVHTLIAENCQTPVVAVGKYAENDLETLQVKSAADLGVLFMDGLVDGIFIDNSGSIASNDILSLSFGILQAVRLRTSKTEFISCPGCGRTMFNLQSVVGKIKSRTSHLKGLKIGIMGCIVNGPGEMADADYGYVGAGRGKVSLYKKHECLQRNIPEEEALDRLIELIKENGDWKDN